MASMGVTPSGQLHTSLQAHVQALMNECFMYTATREGKHMFAAREQLTQFIDNNFNPKRTADAGQE
jgi:hypothetical protein